LSGFAGRFLHAHYDHRRKVSSGRQQGFVEGPRTGARTGINTGVAWTSVSPTCKMRALSKRVRLNYSSNAVDAVTEK